jgi:hypothetical protein
MTNNAPIRDIKYAFHPLLLTSDIPNKKNKTPAIILTIKFVVEFKGRSLIISIMLKKKLKIIPFIFFLLINILLNPI